MFVTLCLHVGYNSAAKRLSLDIGGSKRLHALSTLVSAILLAPWAAFVSLTREVNYNFNCPRTLNFSFVKKR